MRKIVETVEALGGECEVLPPLLGQILSLTLLLDAGKRHRSIDVKTGEIPLLGQIPSLTLLLDAGRRRTSIDG